MTALLTAQRRTEDSLDELLQSIQRLYDDGLYLQGWQAGQSLGPLQNWPGVSGRILAARLGQHLGAGRLSAWLCRCAYREDPLHPDAILFSGYMRLRRRGPYFTWLWWREQAATEWSGERRGSWLGLGSEITASLRDFEVAEQLLADALQADPQSAWLQVVRAGILQLQDRYDDALQVSREALELRPFYRPAVQQFGHLLTLCGRDQEGLDFLAEASDRLECSTVTMQLLALQLELKQFASAEQTLDRAEQLMPLTDKRVKQWLHGQRSEVAYHLGKIEQAIQAAEASDNEYYKTIAQRLKESDSHSRPVVTLPVGFVRQHHKTCGPATLAALSRYWQMPAEHLEVADEICYDGTSNYSERKWAIDHGWVSREFSVTQEATRQLIDRGVPFTFTTVEPGNAHLQAVIGYDDRRGTLLIRDPYWRYSPEGLADKVIERYRPFGPRGHALVPLSHQDKLDGLDLPDAELWDLQFELDAALERHERSLAEAAADRLEYLAPGHRLALEGRRRLAVYDGNPQAHLHAVEQLLTQFPDCQSLQLERLSLLQGHVRREERLATYRELCTKKETHPVFWQRYAHELREDSRQRDEALQLLKRAIRRWPSDGVGYYLLGNVYCDLRRFREAVELYRLAVCLNDKDEQFAWTYFSAARWLKQGDAVLRLLRYRFDQFGRKSSYPAQTLAGALLQVDRDEEALQVLEEAIQLRPDDGDLLLYAADSYTHTGAHRTARSRQLLEQARSKAPRVQWLSTAARLTEQEGQLHEALPLWQELAAFQPLNVPAQQSIARLLAATTGRATAVAHLRALVEQFPHHLPLFETLVQWLRDEPTTVREPALRRGLEQFADNAWLHRELAFLLIADQRLDEARQHAQLAHLLDPLNPSWHYLQADLLSHEGRRAESQAILRKAIELSVDDDYAISRLMEGCASPVERRDAIAFVKQQLVSQVIFGDGLLSFRLHARGSLEAEELLGVLSEALSERPDLWHAWSACILELLSQSKLDQAWELSQQATQRFPLVARLWLDRAEVAHARLDPRAAESALRAALQISPSWSRAVQQLADLLECEQRVEEAEALLRHAAARNPLDPLLQQLLAETLWRLKKHEEAIEYATKATGLDPGFDRPWYFLHLWGKERGQPDLALTAAQQLIEQRGGEARSWLILARLSDRDDQRPKRDEALERVLALNPRCIEAFDQRAKSLAQEKRWGEALAACNTAIWQGRPPAELQVRAASIEAERGDLPAAIARMESVVAEQPAHYKAWSKLADWQRLAADYDGYLRSARMLVTLEPHNEISLGYLGDARLLKDDKAGARQALERALTLNPRYEYAGNALFDLCMEAGEHDQAAAWNERVLQYSCSADALARQAQLAGIRQKPQVVLEALRTIVLEPEADPWCLGMIRDAVQAARCSPEAEQILYNTLGHERMHSLTARLWMELRVARRNWPSPYELRDLLQRGQVGEQALNVYIDLTEQHQDLGRLYELQNRHADWLRANTFCWANIGRGFCSLLQYQPAVEWLWDWRTRADVHPWMLINVAEALRATGQHEEGVECSRHALTLAEQYAQDHHHLLLACDAAVEGQFLAARPHLQAFDDANHNRDLDPDRRLLRTIVAALLEMAGTDITDRSHRFAELRQSLAKARAEHPTFDREPERQRLYRAALSRLAKLRGGLIGRAWQWWLWLGGS